MADDYGSMQSRILDELGDSSLTAQVQTSILSAIKHYEKERWYFTETERTVSASAQTYSLASDFKELDYIRLTYGTTSYWELHYLPWHEMQRITTSSTLLGPPTKYSIAEQKVWLYPIPDTVYTLTEYYEQKLAALSFSTDTNAWMVDGEELIRARAKWDLYLNVVHEADEAAACEAQEKEAYAMLRRSSTTRTVQGRILPQAF